MNGLQALTEETRSQLYKMIQDARKDPLQKAISVPTGLVGINLDAPAKQLVPLMSPFRQTIPRRTKPGSDSNTFRRITALSSPKLSTAEGAASALFTTTLSSVTSTYRVHGLRGQVTREAEAASQGFDPALAKETSNTLLNAMKLEDQYILGANRTALATPGAPTLTERNATGTIGAATYFVRIAALTVPASNRQAIDRPADYDGTDALLAGNGRAGAAVDLETDGVTVAGAEASLAMTGTDNALKITWTAVPGAAAYAVYVGTATGAANQTRECIVTQTSVSLTSLSGTGQAASALTGTTADTLTYDGIIQQLHAVGSGAYISNVNGVLSGALGEVTEIQDMFQSIWDNAKIADLRLLVAGIDSRILTRLGISQDNLRVQVPPSSDGRTQIVQGQHVGFIMNSVQGTVVPVETQPWLPGGTIMALPTSIPYNDANADSPFQMTFGYDWERWDYSSTPTTGPVFPFEIRSYGTIEAVFTGGCGILYNVFKG